MAAYIPLILFTVLTNAAAQIMLKQGMLLLGTFEFTAAGIVAAGCSTATRTTGAPVVTACTVAPAAHRVSSRRPPSRRTTQTAEPTRW